MARNRTFIPVPPERVFEVLSDPFTYQEWVVGTSKIRGADPEYPQVGSRLHHRVGLGPIGVRDHTEVIELEQDRRIVLDAFMRPVARARVRITLEPHEDGTMVLMEEGPADAWSKLTMGGPLVEPLLRIRNTEALSRLRRVALRGGNPIDTPAARDESLRVLVTGGSSGIGLATARRLAGRGARVALIARGEDGLDAALEGFEDTQIPFLNAYSADTTDRTALEAAVDEAARDLEGLDAVVACAAAAAFGPFLETEPHEFDATVESVFTGAVNTVRAAMPHLERSGGSLVVVGSIAGRIPQPQLSAYSAAKHALRGFVESFRAELREDGSPVSICQVDPWAVDTPLANNFSSQTGLLPPTSITAYDSESVAIEIVESIERPRARVTVGRRASVAAFAYGFARPVFEFGLVLASRHLRAGGDRLAGRGGLDGPTGAGKVRGPLEARRSLGAMVSLGRQNLRATLGRS